MRWEEKWKKIEKTGHKRYTILFIPHHKERTFHIQFTLFSLWFSIGIFLLLVVTSLWALERQKKLEKEIQKAYEMDHLSYLKRKEYGKYLERLYQITQKWRELYRERWENIGVEITLPPVELLDESPSEEWEEFLFLKRNHSLLIQVGEEIGDFSQFYKERIVVQKNLPYGWPIRNGRITSGYGPRLSPFGFASEFHQGVDISGPYGSPIYAVGDGYVSFAGYSGGYGKKVVLEHRFGFQTVYAHASRILVRVGKTVKEGEVIALVGSTGKSTGPHVHFEVLIQNKRINPLPFLYGE